MLNSMANHTRVEIAAQVFNTASIMGMLGASQGIQNADPGVSDIVLDNLVCGYYTLDGKDEDSVNARCR